MSIAIPTWGSYGKGDEFIEDLLRTIEIQTFKNFEVCISDHCKDDMVLEVVQKFSEKFKIKYLKNTKDYGNGPANTNKAIDMCSGEVIKVMFQDDFFYDDESLEKIYTSLHNSDRMWLLNGCNHTFDDGWNFVNESKRFNNMVESLHFKLTKTTVFFLDWNHTLIQHCFVAV